MLRVERLHDGALWDVAIGDGKGNILDARLVDALTEMFMEAREATTLRAVCLRGQGKNFSYGASVEEHLPEQVADMLPRFHGLFHAMLDSRVVCLAAVRGQCLGGGLELAMFCHRVFASPDAKFGQPEIVLGVLAPIASLFLAERVGRASAEDLCLSGRTISSEEALGVGLVDVIDDVPDDAARVYAREYLLRHSASSLRFAVLATRLDLKKRMDSELPELERLYLEELMKTADAREGIQAFLDKRSPKWSHR
jgi:cyclohexa-1,5-dienecarbonyl-CoA hydratase